MQLHSLELYFWQLLEVGNLEEAGKVDDQIMEVQKRITDFLASKEIN